LRRAVAECRHEVDSNTVEHGFDGLNGSNRYCDKRNRGMDERILGDTKRWIGAPSTNNRKPHGVMKPCMRMVRSVHIRKIRVQIVGTRQARL